MSIQKLAYQCKLTHMTSCKYCKVHMINLITCLSKSDNVLFEKSFIIDNFKFPIHGEKLLF